MIYKEPTVYKHGLSESDVKRIIEEENKNNYVWVNITDKLGTKATLGLSLNFVNIFYNKNLGLIRITIYSVFSPNVQGANTVFNFNSDLPELGTTGAFSSESVVSIDGMYTGSLRAFPFTHSNVNYDHKISIYNPNNYSEVFSGSCFTIINKDLVNQFNTYLGM